MNIMIRLFAVQCLILLVMFSKAFGQDNMGVGTSSPEPSAVLDLSASDKGFLVPRMTTQQRTLIFQPASGLMVYDTDFSQFWYYNGSQWVQAVGPEGPQGVQGPAGVAGAQGPAGVNGAIGPQGPAGVAGPAGATGPQGLQGVQGPAGLNGADGATGPQGLQGIQGPAGADGADGATGPQGAQGPQGPAGTDGADGVTGPQGPAGADGATGPQGLQGADGADGATGPIGPQGIQGLTGAQGPQGPVGAVGATGPQGPQGLTGAQGPQGLQGAVGPAGSAGAQGPAGPIGSAGPAGPQGAQGVQGAQGPQGSAGPVGCGSANYVVKSNGSVATCSSIYDNGTRVGVFTSSPVRNMHVVHDQFTGSSYYGGLEIDQVSNGSRWTIYTSQSVNDLKLYYNDVQRGSFDDVNGNYTSVSDIRLKKNIETLDATLGKIMLLRPTQYHFKSQEDSEERSFGLIAQELMDVFPELVSVSGDDSNGTAEIKDLHTVSYTELIPILIKGMQEQQQQIENLKLELDYLKSTNK